MRATVLSVRLRLAFDKLRLSGFGLAGFRLVGLRLVGVRLGTFKTGNIYHNRVT